MNSGGGGEVGLGGGIPPYGIPVEFVREIMSMWPPLAELAEALLVISLISLDSLLDIVLCLSDKTVLTCSTLCSDACSDVGRTFFALLVGEVNFSCSWYTCTVLTRGVLSFVASSV